MSPKAYRSMLRYAKEINDWKYVSSRNGPHNGAQPQPATSENGVSSRFNESKFAKMSRSCSRVFTISVRSRGKGDHKNVKRSHDWVWPKQSKANCPSRVHNSSFSKCGTSGQRSIIRSRREHGRSRVDLFSVDAKRAKCNGAL